MAEDRAAAQAASKIASFESGVPAHDDIKTRTPLRQSTHPRSEQASLDRAVRSAAAAVNATADAIRTAGAPTAALIAAEATKKDEIFVTLKDRRAARDAAVAEVEAEAAAKIELANRQVAEIEANVKGDADAVALSYGFAALAGGLLVGNELGLGLAPAGLVGAGLGVGAMFLWGVQKAEPVPSTASATAEE